MTKQELATKIWATANELRKNIKASEYKDYILGFMFYKYLCDKEIDCIKTIGGEIEDLKDLDDGGKNTIKDEIGYFIPYENLFQIWKTSGVNLGAKDVAEALDNFYLNLIQDCKKLFDKVFSALQSGLTKLGENSGSRDKAVRDMVDLVDLIPPTSKNYDVLGYIYEYLIQQFSSEAKKDGAFYTPHELTHLMARIVAERVKGKEKITCYDPTTGSGGLLLNIGKAASKYIKPENIKYYGQELISETANLAKMNLFMQGVPVQNIYMRNANTLEDDWPYFDEQTSYEPLFVDAVVSNPPYSAHYEPEKHITDERFKGYGLAPSGKADYAFLLHCLYHIKNDGIMAIVLPHGVLFRGDSEGEIRKNLILNHNIETIISMPAQLFFATGIPVIVAILSKNRNADDILFIDASQSFKKDKTQNVLTKSDVQRIFDAVMARKDIPNFAHLASLEEIEANGYNLNVPRYISASKEEAALDLYSVMTGEISDEELKAFAPIWKEFPSLKEKIFETQNGYNAFKDVNFKAVSLEDSDVKSFSLKFLEKTEAFRGCLKENLISKNASPKLYDKIVEKLFMDFKNQPLIDVYSLYQAFSDNWETVEIDLARIEEEGFEICKQIEANMITRKDPKTKKTIEEQRGFKGKIMPFSLIKKEFFKADYEEMEKLSKEADSYAAKCDEIWDSLDEDSKSYLLKNEEENEYDVKKLKAESKKKNLNKEALNSAKEMLLAMEKEANLRKKVKEIENSLDTKAKEKIENLSDEEVAMLLEKKWIDPIISAINTEAENIFTKFSNDLNALKQKYQDPLSKLSAEIEETNKLLIESMQDLTGSDTDMKAIKMLMEELV